MCNMLGCTGFDVISAIVFNCWSAIVLLAWGGFLQGQRLTRSVARLGCTGGGAHKYRATLEETLDVRVVPIDEMESLVRGIEFVVEHVVGSLPLTVRTSS